MRYLIGCFEIASTAALILSCSGAYWPSTRMIPSFATATVIFPPSPCSIVAVVAEIYGLDFDFGEIHRRRRRRSRLLCEDRRGQRNQGCRNGHPALVHFDPLRRS